MQNVTNLSHLKYHLFSGARAPATVVIGRKRQPDKLDFVNVHRPRLSSLPFGRKGDVWALLVSQTDVQTIRYKELCSGENGWLSPLMLGILERRTRDALLTWTRSRSRSVADFLNRSGLRIKRGGNSEETGVTFPTFIDKRGKKRTKSIFSLGDFPRENIDKEYRPLFSPDVLLIPRSFSGIRILHEPHAFNSSYYGVAPNRRWPRRGDSSADTSVDQDDPALILEEVQCLRALKAFLESDVVAYFASLFGATYLMDKARLEMGDIRSLPCPFEDSNDPGFLVLGETDDVNGTILTALGAGADLRRTVEEFVEFTKGYADAQLPQLAFADVERKVFDTYVERFTRELTSSFRERYAPKVRTYLGSNDGTFSVHVIFANDDVLEEAHSESADPDGRFVAASIVSFDRRERIGQVKKTTARFAWTADQAVADAEALTELIIASRG